MSETQNLITPQPKDVFKPFALTPLSKVKVVLMMPEAFCGSDTATGLAFGWKKGDIHKDFDTAPVPFHSLMLELHRDVQVKIPEHGCLDKWARQGVLLWNALPSSMKGIPGAHLGLGWNALTEEIVETVYLSNPNTIFVFFGPTNAYAKILPPNTPSLELPMPKLINGGSNLEGCAIFSTINKALKGTGQRKINWKL